MNYADSEYDHSSKGKVQVWNLQHLRTFSAPFQHQMLKAVRKRSEGAKLLEFQKCTFPLIYTQTGIKAVILQDENDRYRFQKLIMINKKWFSIAYGACSITYIDQKIISKKYLFILQNWFLEAYGQQL
jgi:hypothetical protein